MNDLQRYACLNTDHFFFSGGGRRGYGTRIGMNIIIFFTPAWSAPPNMDTLRRACEEKRIVLNDDSCADESRDEALKDCFVDARE